MRMPAACLAWVLLSCAQEVAMTDIPEVRKGQGQWPLPRDEIERRLRARFYDSRFDAEEENLQQLIDIAWKNYKDNRKSPRRRPAPERCSREPNS
jgi:hypothetical protein